jgi:hypothetical protein
MDSATSDVIAYLQSRCAPCPRCNYELHDLKHPTCPECGEPLILKIGSPKVHFGWLLLAAAPGCFSAVAVVLMLVPVLLTIRGGFLAGVPYPILGAWVFGVISTASIFVLYRERHRVLRRSTRGQILFALLAWAVHILAFILTVTAQFYLTRTPAAPAPAAPTVAPAPAPPAP